MLKLNRFFISLLIILNGCKPISEIQMLFIQASGSPKHPVKIGVGSFFPLGVQVNLIDTPNAQIKYRFIPGEMLSINNDTSFRFYYSDSVLVDYTIEPPKFYTSNLENSKYNQFYGDLSSVLSPIYQNNLIYFYGKEDSITADENFIANHLLKSDSLIMKKADSLFVKYQFSNRIASSLLSSILETQKLSLSYFYFRKCIPKLDSTGRLPLRLKYYIDEVNQQEISIFSLKNISLLIEAISYQLIKKSIYHISEQEELQEYYLQIQKLFVKGSVSYDYLISSLEVQAIRNKIKLKGANLRGLKNDAKKSKFKKYVQSNYTTVREGLKDLPVDKNLYAPSFYSTDLSIVISQFKDKPLLIDFWASWCLPCLKKIPEIVNYKEQYPNLNLLFISLDKSQDIWKLYLYKNDLGRFLQYRRNYNNQDILFKQILVIPKYGLLQKNGKIELFDEVTDLTIKNYYESF